MSKRTARAVADLLTDPDNEQKTAEEVAELVIERIRELDSATDRLAVVAQIQEGPRPPLTVVLGPFSARGRIDAPEKFEKSVAGGSAARTAGQGMAWNPSTKLGRGRFLLAPQFRSPRDAWAFYGQLPAEAGGPTEDELYELAHVTTAWDPQLIEPACCCGLPAEVTCRWCQATFERRCHKHQTGGEIHHCR